MVSYYLKHRYSSHLEQDLEGIEFLIDVEWIFRQKSKAHDKFVIKNVEEKKHFNSKAYN